MRLQNYPIVNRVTLPGHFWRRRRYPVVALRSVNNGATLEIGGRQFLADLVVLPGVGIDVILGMNWMSGNGVLINTTTRVVMLRDPSTREAFLE